MSEFGSFDDEPHEPLFKVDGFDIDESQVRSRVIESFTLPSGKPINIVAFGELAEDNVSINHRPLCECQECGYDRVQPVSLSPPGLVRHIGLRCPDCETCRETRLTQNELDEFKRDQKDASQSRKDDIKMLVKAFVAAENEAIDKFVDDLNSGQILPEDF